MAEFWLISAPGDKTCQQTWEKLNAATTKQNNLSVNHKFNIPELKVGTLDVLVGLSDDLAKLDAYTDSVARKVAQYLGDVLEEQKDKWSESLKANNLDLETYMTRFQWDLAKYPIKQPLKNIAEIVSKQMSQIENDLKKKSSEYNGVKSSLQSLERKQAGSLLTRNLADLVKKDNFILDSEYITTLLVVVPKTGYQDWRTKYETLSDMVVPRSTDLIFEDAEAGLFTVTLFQRAIDTFKHKCRENKFIVREFSYNEKTIADEKQQYTKLEADKRRQYAPLVRWLTVNFSEAFTAWIHVKAMRVFVESVLRYGLPVNFQALLIQPFKKSQKRLREVLHQLYAHLDSSGASGGDVGVDLPSLNLNLPEYHPYVYYDITLNFTDKK